MENSDQEVTRRLRAELEQNPSLPCADLRIVVENGVVHLDGLLDDPRAAEAIRRAAEIAAGPGNVDDTLVVLDAVAASAIALG